MTLIDFTLLNPPPHLWVSFDTSMNANQQLRWLILDANNNDQLYTRAANLDHAIAFVRAAVKHGDATCDETSIEFHRMFRASLGQHSVRVPSSVGAPTAVDDAAAASLVSQAPTDGAKPAAPADSTRLRLVL